MPTFADKLLTFAVAPAGGSALATLAASLAADQWGSLATTNVMDCDPSGSAGSSIIQYSQCGNWDSVNKLYRMWLGRHGNSGTYQRQFMGTYRDGANAFIATPDALPNDVTSNPAHGWGQGPGIDPVTGDVYGVTTQTASTMSRWNFTAGAFDAPMPSLTYPGLHDTAGVGVHPGLYGGAGGVVWFGNDGIWTSPFPRNATPVWTQILGTLDNDQTLMGGLPICSYSRKDSCLYVGGGTSGTTTKLYKVAASAGAGTASLVATPGYTLGTWDDFSNNGTLTAAGNSSNRLCSLRRDGQIFEYNEVGNSWAQLGISVPSGILGGSNNWNVCSCPDYGCILVVKGVNVASHEQTEQLIHVWKH